MDLVPRYSGMPGDSCCLVFRNTGNKSTALRTPYDGIPGNAFERSLLNPVTRDTSPVIRNTRVKSRCPSRQKAIFVVREKRPCPFLGVSLAPGEAFGCWFGSPPRL